MSRSTITFRSFFDGDSRFTILNRYAGDISSITGSTVVSVIDIPQEALKIQFSNGMTTTVGLKDDDYRGPEAFRFYDRALGIDIVEQ